MNPFDKHGQWYKGALHVHTTNSDGRRSPQDSMDAHRAHGYDFLSITDHNTITDLSASSTVSFLNIPGVEVSYDRNAVGQSYHVCVIGTRTWLDLPKETPIQQALDRWAEVGALRILAHPYWSGMITPEMLPLNQVTGLEVYNTSADTDLGKALASVHWDDLLVRGKRWWGYAVDDTHGIDDDEFGAWVWAKADKLDETSILAALLAGEFYASSGPEIYDYRIEHDVAYMRCSPCRCINLIGHTQWGRQRHAARGGTITEAEFKLTGNEGYLRAECVDVEGYRAWTNPVFLS